MLGKLMKHEWRSVWKIPGSVNLFLLLYTLAGIISFHSPIWESDNKIIEALLIFASSFYFIMITLISFIVMIYLTIRFYKNLYTDEGYLMHTLPVSQKELILSKLIVAFIWTLITAIVIIVSVASVMITAVSIGNNGISVAQMWDAFMQMINAQFLEWFRELFGISFFHGIMLFLALSIISILYGILMIYASISLGQLMQKHKILGSVLGYIGIHTVLQLINTLTLTPLMLNMSNDTTVAEVFHSFIPYCYFMLGESIIFCIVFFFLTEYLMKKKLNLD